MDSQSAPLSFSIGPPPLLLHSASSSSSFDKRARGIPFRSGNCAAYTRRTHGHTHTHTHTPGSRVRLLWRPGGIGNAVKRASSAPLCRRDPGRTLRRLPYFLGSASFFLSFFSPSTKSWALLKRLIFLVAGGRRVSGRMVRVSHAIRWRNSCVLVGDGERRSNEVILKLSFQCLY